MAKSQEALAKQALLLLAKDYRACEQSLARFTKAAWHVVEPGTRLRWNWHHNDMCSHIKAVVNFVTNRWPGYPKIQNLIINVPFGSTKTTIASIMLVPWIWTFAPWVKSLNISHGEDLATEISMSSRAVVESKWYQQWWGDLKEKNQWLKERWQNTSRGFRASFGMTTGGTGEHGDLNVFDDPHDAASAVYSRAELEKGTNAYKTKWISRLTDPARSGQIIIMQRLNMDDLSGMQLRAGGWVHLRIPFCFEADDPCETPIGWRDPRTEDGQFYWPDQYNKKWHGTYTKAATPFDVAGQLQQRPIPMGGGMCNLDWFGRYDVPPEPGDIIEKIQVLDTAHKGDEMTNSPWVILTGAITSSGTWDILDVHREWYDTPAGRDAVIMQANKHLPQMGVIEDKATGQGLLQELPALANWVAWVPFVDETWFLKLDKIARFGISTTPIKAGRVRLPREAPWLKDFEYEVASAGPGSATLDQVDCLSMFVRTCEQREREIFHRESSHQVHLEEWPDEGPEDWLF